MRIGSRVRREHSVPGLVRPVAADAPWVVANPPVPAVRDGGVGQTLMGALGSLGMVGFALAGGSRIFLLIAIGLAGLTLVAALGGRVHGSRRARAGAAALRHRWRSHLAIQLQGALDAGEVQRRERVAAHPGIQGLLARSRGGVGLWWDDSDPAEDWLVRLGTGFIPARQPLRCEPVGDPLAESDPELTSEVAAAVAGAARIADAPVVYGWPPGSVLALVGPLAETRPVARAIVAELLVRRPPGRLRVTVDAEDAAAWSWLAWLPHDVALGASAGAGELLVREAATGPAGTARTLLLAPTRRSVPPAAQVFEVDALPAVVGRAGSVSCWASLDAVQAALLARCLAPRVVAGRQTGRSGEISVFDLMGAAAPPRGGLDLRTPVGVADGVDLWLDLREPAAGGDGPHGLLIGATGSGKSELLRSMVLGLAWRHPPEELAFVLADWKGGAAFDDVAALPHVAGLMTNLSDDRRQVSRVTTALRAELNRRQVVLREADAESLAALRSRDPGRAPPALVVVLDEFGELLAAEPDILDVLVACGRLGRSLGVHLLLSSQRFEEGRLRGLESHLRYRICLRVASGTESQSVIGTADAAALPAEPGWGYLSIDGVNRRFRAAHSSRPVAAQVSPDPVRPLALAHRDVAADGGGESERVRAVRTILDLGRARVPPVWHAPLPALLPWPAESAAGWTLALGVADDVPGQQQPPWLLELETCGHVGAVGGPGAGASTLVRGIIAAAVGSLTSRDLGLVVADFGGLDRSGLDALPHLLCVAGPEDPDLALAALRWVAQTVEARGQHARRHGVTGPAGWRRAREAGELIGIPGDDGADLLLVMDGLARAREDIEEVDALLGIVAGGGLRVRVRMVVTAQRWGDIRPALRDLLATRWELRLTDQGESAFARQAAALMDGAPPGRVVTLDGLLAQAYQAPEELRSRGGVRSRRLLPLPAVVSGRSAGELAIRAGDLAALRCDARSHLVILGDRGSGRTQLLHRLGISASADPLARRLTVVDPRRTLTGLAQRPGIRWTSGGADTDAAVAELVETLTDRRLGSATAGPHATRWWSGPEHLLIVDDADLVPGGAYGGAFAALAEFVRIGPDLGFGVALARPVTGLSRNGFEPFTATLRDCAGTTVILRGDPAEGAIAGGLRARPDRPPGRCSWLTEAGVIDAQLLYDAGPRPDIEAAVQEVA